MTSGTRRMWSEMVPLGELARSSILAELARRGVSLLAAVLPEELEHGLALVERARELGLSIGLWPLLPDARGRWLHPGNAGEFERWIGDLLEALDRRSLRLDALALDLEPPIAEVRRALGGDLRAMGPWVSRALDAAPHRRITRELAARDIEVLAAVPPPVLLGGRASRGWQRALGTPVDEVPYDVVSAMLYTTLFQGYSAGVLRRGDALGLLDRFSRLARARFGERASVSLGAVGRGALSNERTYERPGELAEDVALVRATGMDDLALFDLAGVLSRPPAERWLDALTETEPSPAPCARSARAEAVLSMLWVGGVLLDHPRRR